MAFSARELRLILSIQSYGTGNIARLRSDLLTLSAASRKANLAQAAIQKKVLQDQEKYVRLQDRIAKMEQTAINKQISLRNKADAAASHFAQRRMRIQQRESALGDAILAKQLQIARSKDRVSAMSGSGMQRFATREAALATQRLRINKQIAMLPAREAQLSSRVLNNKAQILARERQLRALRGKSVDLERMASGSLRGFGSRTKELAYRYRAVLQTQKALVVEQKQFVRNAEILNSQLNGILAQEELIKAQKFEQAAAMQRQIEQTALYQSQLATIEARQAQITAEVSALDTEENKVNAEIQEQLRLLRLENVELERAKVKAGELAAELAAGQGPLMRQAAAMDRMTQRLNRLQRIETRFRLAAHAGRTAQFGGLIGLAGFAGAGNMFANFSEQITLAASQARKVERPLSDIPKLADAMTHGIHGAGVEIEGIIDLMQQFPATGDEMAQAAYDIFSSMDVSFGGGMKLLKMFNQLAVASGSDLATAVDAGITVLNNFGAESGTVSEKLNLMMTIIRFGRMRLEDLNAMFEKVAPAATAAGQSLQDVAGAMVAVTRLQPSQRVGATGIARLLQTFRDPDFQKGAAKFGVDMTIGAGAVGKLKPLPEIIGAFAKNFGLFQAQGGPGQLFQELTAVGRGRGIGRASRIEAQNAFTFLVGHWRQYRALQKLATGDTKEFNIALKAMSDAPGVKWKIFINQMRALILTIGEAALPAILGLVTWLQKAARWFQDLSDRQKYWIVRLGVGAAAVMLLAGTLGNLVASIGAAVTSVMAFRAAANLAAISAGEAAVQGGLLAASMKILAGIGLITIPIVMQLIKGGEPGLWDFLQAAGYGAAGGFMIGGAPGAVLGAITLPVVIKVMSEKEQNKQAQTLARLVAKKMGMDLGKDISLEEFKLIEDWAEKHPKQIEALAQKHNAKKLGIDKAYLQELNKLNRETVQGELDKASELAKAYGLQDTKLTQHQRKMQQMQKIHNNAMQAGRDAEEEAVKQGVENMIALYERMEDANKAAMGIIGQGPVMQGILGNVFTGLNDMLRQFGVQIPIPFEIVRADMEMQMKYFKRWTQDLTKLRKAGLPEPLVQQIQQMGPDQGIAIAEGILSGGKAGINQFKTMWKQGQRAIKTQTEKDLNAQLAYWKTFGNEAAYQMIMGIINNPENASLQKKFRNYIKSNFASQLAVVFSKAFTDAMKQGIEDMNAAAEAAGIPIGGPGKGRGKGRHRTALQIAEANLPSLTRNAREARAQLRRAIAGSVNPLGPAGMLQTPSELNVIRRMQAKNTQAQAQLKAARDIILRDIQNQVRTQRARHPGIKEYAITYGGDVIHVSATMSPKEIARFFARRSFQKRNKKHRGGTKPKAGS